MSSTKMAPPRTKQADPDNPWPERMVKLRAKWGREEAKGRPFTQAEAAAKIGVTLRSWASWERGARLPLQPMQMLIDCLLKSKK